MRRSPRPPAPTLALLVLLLALPSIAATPGITMCKSVLMPDYTPVDVADVFPADQPVLHALVAYDDPPGQVNMRGVWIAVDVTDEPDFEIMASEVVLGEGGRYIDFEVSAPTAGWPPGNYRFDCYADGRRVSAATFRIVGAQATATGPAPTAQAPAPQPSAPPPPQTPQGLGGTWIMEQQGVRVVLEINQSADGMLNGTFGNQQGTMTIEGYDQEGVGVGMVYDDQGGCYFEAHPDGSNLLFYMIEPDANGEPDYDNYRELPFARAGGGGGQTDTRPAPGMNAMGGMGSQSPPMSSPPAAATGGSGLSGVWARQDREEILYVVFESASSLVFEGERCPYRDDGRNLHVQSAQAGAMDYAYELSGDRLSISAQGQTFVFTRLPSQDPGLIVSRLCTYSGFATSASVGNDIAMSGSNTNQVSFDGRGGFTLGSESSFTGSGAGVGAYSHGQDSDSGRYYIAGDKVLLVFNDGTMLPLDIHNRNRDGRVTELMYGKKVAAAGLCE